MKYLPFLLVSICTKSSFSFLSSSPLFAARRTSAPKRELLATSSNKAEENAQRQVTICTRDEKRAQLAAQEAATRLAEVTSRLTEVNQEAQVLLEKQDEAQLTFEKALAHVETIQAQQAQQQEEEEAKDNKDEIIEKAKAELQAAKDAVNEAKVSCKKAESNAKSLLKKEKKKVDSAKKNSKEASDNVEFTQEVYDNALVVVQQLTSIQTKAQQTMDNASEEDEDDAKAKESLDAAIQASESAQQKLQDAQTAAENAKKAHQTAKDIIKEAESNLKAVETSTDEQIAKENKLLETALATQTSAQQALEEAQQQQDDDVKVDSTTVVVDSKEIKKAQKDLDDAKKVLDDITTKAQTASKEATNVAQLVESEQNAVRLAQQEWNDSIRATDYARQSALLTSRLLKQNQVYTKRSALAQKLIDKQTEVALARTYSDEAKRHFAPLVNAHETASDRCFAVLNYMGLLDEPDMVPDPKNDDDYDLVHGHLSSRPWMGKETDCFWQLDPNLFLE